MHRDRAAVADGEYAAAIVDQHRRRHRTRGRHLDQRQFGDIGDLAVPGFEQPLRLLQRQLGQLGGGLRAAQRLRVDVGVAELAEGREQRVHQCTPLAVGGIRQHGRAGLQAVDLGRDFAQQQGTRHAGGGGDQGFSVQPVFGLQNLAQRTIEQVGRLRTPSQSLLCCPED